MSVSAEKIPRRELPEFNESQESLVGGLIEDGFLRVALDDANQYGPHAMIILLFAVATFTAMALLLATLF
mgnify:CR=1 FL=1|tara:strand:- start:14873 stop:15082 length:210 start_codon:yes stop_codon:yes gene_type:complete